MKKKEYNPKVPAVEQAVKVLMCLTKAPSYGMNLTSICKEVGIHKSKGYGILTTLKEFGLVKKDESTKKYTLGPALIFLASKVLENMDYKIISEPYLIELANETGCASFFGLIVDDYIYVIAKHDVDLGLKLTIPLGYRFPITYGAHGKAIFASLKEKEREKILNTKNLYFHGYKEVDLKKMCEEVKFYEKHGFAIDIKEMDPRFNAIASAVLGLKGKVVGVVVIIGVFEEDKVFEYGLKVKKCAEKISYALGAKRKEGL